MAKLEQLQENLVKMKQKKENLEIAIEQLEQKIARKDLHEKQALLASKKVSTKPVSETNSPEEVSETTS